MLRVLPNTISQAISLGFLGSHKVRFSGNGEIGLGDSWACQIAPHVGFGNN
jgi:hypothetical protein